MSISRFETSQEYYAVIFSALRAKDAKNEESSIKFVDDEEYSKVAERMDKLASGQPGFLGMESTRDQAGFGITISYWKDLDAIRNWRENLEHQAAQKSGKARWYSDYQIRICIVNSEYAKPIS